MTFRKRPGLCYCEKKPKPEVNSAVFIVKALIPTADKKTERAFLVGLYLRNKPNGELEDSLEELGELAKTAGGTVVGQGTQKLNVPEAGTYIGAGKAKEFAELCKARQADTVIFDDELSPAQVRNLEHIFGCKILDRTSLILDIFAERAQTREGKLQVELAQLQYLYPRLTRYWTHLHRQRGGIGTQGEGEKQLELDRRRVQWRIDKIRGELDEVRKHRTTQRQGRQRHEWPLASIVGYTNAGKSTLLNALTEASVSTEDKLFATLDPTTRHLNLPNNKNVLLSDTVGFIRKLPHRLVAAFKATLEEVVQAELLVHVVDVSHPRAEEQIASVNSVLNEIDAGDKPTLMVFNKLDRVGSDNLLEKYLSQYPGSVAVSAKNGNGLSDLLCELSTHLRPNCQLVEIEVPYSESAVIAKLHEKGQVVERDYNGKAARLKALLPPWARPEFEPFILPDFQEK